MSILKQIAKVINQKNLDKGLKSFDKIMADFKKSISDLGDSMGKVDQDFKDDIKKSNIQKEKRTIQDKKNIDSIWGKKKE